MPLFILSKFQTFPKKIFITYYFTTVAYVLLNTIFCYTFMEPSIYWHLHTYNIIRTYGWEVRQTIRGRLLNFLSLLFQCSIGESKTWVREWVTRLGYHCEIFKIFPRNHYRNDEFKKKRIQVLFIIVRVSNRFWSWLPIPE